MVPVNKGNLIIIIQLDLRILFPFFEENKFFGKKISKNPATPK